MQLTEEQQAIVAHTHGAALVFAVAGSGKTTAMVARIQRLVDEGAMPARSILATSFSRATVGDLKRQLRNSLRCAEVGIYTLHAIGFQALRAARKLGYFDFAESDVDAEAAPNVVLARARKEARFQKVSYAKELENLDREDFLSYVSACKSNLQYADLKKSKLSEAALKIASQATTTETIPWYLDLYGRYEAVREEMRLITYDDMLMRGWEMLASYPRVLAEVSGKYQSVMVDEFQDVNLAQSEMLDLLTAAHRNYMAIGDDDQTIFEFRGASPKFILGFAERYGAKKYTISENFRCQASQVALANKVIEHNTQREPKRLQLTKGFGGNTFVVEGAPDAAAQYITKEIKQETYRGRGLRDFAILVRVYAQTPVIEQALTREGIPYRIVGSQPFYRRPEIAVLLNYLRLIPFERMLREGKRLTGQELRSLRDAWLSVYNAPNRYFARDAAENILKEVGYRGGTLSTTISLNNSGSNASAKAKIDKLAADLEWLADTDPSKPAAEILTALVERLRYREALLGSSGFVEVGEGRVANVEAFLAYAKQQGTVEQLLDHVAQLSRQYQYSLSDDQDDEDQNYVKVMTIHRSKGLEWPVVFVPDCNEGTFPPKKAQNVEEERRLLYVAITRTMETLHLFIADSKSASTFLTAADYQGTLAKVARVAKALREEPARLSSEDAYHVQEHIHELCFGRYLQHRWDAPEEQRQRFWERLRTNQYTPPPVVPVKLPVPDGESRPGSVNPRRTGRERVVSPVHPTGSYAKGERVRHPIFGEGTITSSSIIGTQETVQVVFPGHGVKKLATEFAKLERVSGTPNPSR